MANLTSRLAVMCKHLITHNNALNSSTRLQLRNVTFTASGAVESEPFKASFGLLKVMATVIPGLYIGATISKTGATFLEENDIFVPDEDDDDD